MRPDTPLEEVVHHLPPAAVARLSPTTHDIQQAVLAQVRSMVVYWETQRYVFDPVAYEGILDVIVAACIPMFQEIVKLRGDVAILSSRLAGAELLVESLNTSLAQMQDLYTQEPNRE